MTCLYVVLVPRRTSDAQIGAMNARVNCVIRAVARDAAVDPLRIKCLRIDEP